MIKASAPGSFAIIGDPADMFGGSVISCTLRDRAYCSLDDSPLTKQITVEVGDEKATIASAEDLRLRGDCLDLPRAVLAALEVLSTSDRPFALVANRSVSLNESLAGPTAMLTAVVGSVLAHLGLYLNLYETAELVRRIETDLLRSLCGFHAQYASTFGGICYMDFRDKDCGASHEHEAPFATVEPISPYVEDLRVLVATVESETRTDSRNGSSITANACDKLTRLAYLAKKALLAEQWYALGELINQSNAIQRELVGPDGASDRMVQAAIDGGALGARRLAGGAGVLAVTLEPESISKALMAAGSKAVHSPTLSRGLTVEITS